MPTIAYRITLESGKKRCNCDDKVVQLNIRTSQGSATTDLGRIGIIIMWQRHLPQFVWECK